MNIRDIEGARPTEFTSKELRRDYMNICDIEGARPSIMKGYGGVMKQYEQPFSLSKISQLPYAGVSKKDNHVENDLFKMSNEQNSAADFIEFMRKKKGNRDNKPAGIINMGFRRNAKKFKYQYQPPYGYGGNFSTGVKKCPYDRNICTSGLRQNSYNLLGQASRDHNSHSRSENRGSYLGRLGNKILKPPTALDPNLDIQQISDFIDPKVRHHSSSKKKKRTDSNSGANIFPPEEEEECTKDDQLEEDRKNFFLIEEKKQSPLPPLNPKSRQNHIHNKRYSNAGIDSNVYSKLQNQESSNKLNAPKRELNNRSSNLEHLRNSRQNNCLTTSASNILPAYENGDLKKPLNVGKYNYDSNHPYEVANFEKKRSMANMSRNRMENHNTHQGGQLDLLGDQNRYYQSYKIGKEIPDLKSSQRMNMINPRNNRGTYSYDLIAGVASELRD
ncbi:unnamed protein product [Moneuplotes crassus]|uniref:Uncharacterized protein n=1 Tax=Euplotes crassus TaxID=5936 RepID=A0AAD1UEH8_EUPCR|nr:unnamed protein product [Moneuplotes crassus]